MDQPADIIASVHFFSSAEGGRQTVITRDLNCSMIIDDLSFVVRLYFDAKRSVSPGQTITVPVKFLSPSLAMQHCTVGKNFKLREMRMTAEGTILSICRYE